MIAAVSPESDAVELLTGAVLDGKYRVGRSLDEGGMGAVYLAEHIGIARNVALKIVRPELLTEPTAAERFKRKARASGGIQHRNVVNVTDFGIATVAGTEVAYLVMQQVASALTAAHAVGVVHRDRKPANIWLAPDDRGGFRVTLLDFGIAKLRDDGLVSRASAPVGAAPIATADIVSEERGEDSST